MPRVQTELGTCFLPQHMLAQMLSEADHRAPLETGGVLLGVTDAVNVWVDAVVGPGPAARRGTTWFVPDSDYQHRRIAELYEASGRRIAYLGDWHTHPNAPPALSWRDARTLRKIARSVGARQPNPLMLILGQGAPWQAAVWRCVATRWYRPSCRHIALKVTITR